MLKLYYGRLSGHSYKIRLFLSLIGLGYEPVPINMAQGENKTESYLKINPLGLVPVLQDDDFIIRDSQAILVYLAQKYAQGSWKLPSEAAQLAHIIEWLSFAANEISHSVVLIRRAYMFKKGEAFPAEIDVPQATEKTHRILGLLEKQLATRDWLALEHASIADIACFVYVDLIQQETPFPLGAYVHVQQWIQRIKALEGYIPLIPAT